MMIPVDNQSYSVWNVWLKTQPPTSQKHPTVVVRKASTALKMTGKTLWFQVLNIEPTHAGGSISHGYSGQMVDSFILANVWCFIFKRLGMLGIAGPWTSSLSSPSSSLNFAPK